MRTRKFSRKYGRKRRNVRRRRVAPLRRTIRRIARRVFNSNVETKYNSKTFTDSYDAAASRSYLMPLILAEGVAQQNRIGLQVKMKSFRLSMMFSVLDTNAADTTVYNINARFIIGVFKKMPRQGMTSIGLYDILENSTVYAKINSDLFTPWVDRLVPMSSLNGYSNTGFKYKHFARFTKKFIHKWEMQGDDQQNNLQEYNQIPIIFWMTDQVTSGKITMYTNGNYRIAYTDA